MSHKTKKRREQRQRARERAKFREDYLSYFRRQAFEEWLENWRSESSNRHRS